MQQTQWVTDLPNVVVFILGLGGLAGALLLMVKLWKEFVPDNDHALAKDTSGNVTVNYSTAQFASGMAVWNLINPASITPTFTGNNNTNATAALSISVTVPTGGAAMLLDSTNVSSGNGTWTNATELYDNANGSVYRSGAIRTTAGTATVTITRPNTQNHTFVAAAWSP